MRECRQSSGRLWPRRRALVGDAGVGVGRSFLVCERPVLVIVDCLDLAVVCCRTDFGRFPEPWSSSSTVVPKACASASTVNTLGSTLSLRSSLLTV